MLEFLPEQHMGQAIQNGKPVPRLPGNVDHTPADDAEREAIAAQIKAAREARLHPRRVTK